MSNLDSCGVSGVYSYFVLFLFVMANVVCLENGTRFLAESNQRDTTVLKVEKNVED